MVDNSKNVIRKITMDNFYKRLGAELKARCKAERYTQSMVADDLGLTYQQVQKYFSGANRVPVHNLIIICRMLGCKMCDVVKEAEK